MLAPEREVEVRLTPDHQKKLSVLQDAAARSGLLMQASPCARRMKFTPAEDAERLRGLLVFFEEQYDDAMAHAREGKAFAYRLAG